MSTFATAQSRDFYSVGCATVLLSVPRLAARLGVNVTLATETFQRTGSFKFRAAYVVASAIAQTEIITANSGNFGQAMASACKLLSKRCTVVMPKNSATVKVDAVPEHGGVVDLIDTTKVIHEARVRHLAGRYGSYAPAVRVSESQGGADGRAILPGEKRSVEHPAARR